MGVAGSLRQAIGRLRWYELVPEAVLVAGLTYFLIDETDVATGAFSSTRAVTLVVVVAAGWLVARVVLARFVHLPALRLVVFGAAAIALLAIVVLPAYDNTTVVETFPQAAARPSASTIKPGDSASDVASSSSTAVAAEPLVIGSGTLEGIDHRASGTVNVYRRADGTHVIGLEDIDVQPGPDYDVYVVPGADREELHDAARLDDLRGNKGTQYYDVGTKADFDDGPWTVLIWCQTFSVPIANATPA